MAILDTFYNGHNKIFLIGYNTMKGNTVLIYRTLFFYKLKISVKVKILVSWEH